MVKMVAIAGKSCLSVLKIPEGSSIDVKEQMDEAENIVKDRQTVFDMLGANIEAQFNIERGAMDTACRKLAETLLASAALQREADSEIQLGIEGELIYRLPLSGSPRLLIR